MKKWLTPSVREEEDDDAISSSKKAKKDDGHNGFITSSPNVIRKPPAKGQQKDLDTNVLSPVKKVSRNLNADFEAIEKNEGSSQPESSSQEDSSDESKAKRKSLLNTLFSPFYTLLVPTKSSSPGNTSLRSSQEKSSPIIKNELSTDESIAEISILSKETPEKIQYDLYDPYNNSVEEVEEEEEECEEFDPYLFIANLPPITQLAPRQRARLPPKGDTPKHTLVLDLDETLVHCSTEPLENAELTFPVMYGGKEYQVFVRRRPHFETFLKRVSQLFEVVVFTASQEVYASRLLDLIDPNGKYIHHRLYRDACVEVEGNYLKDLTVLGRDLSKTVIVDNSPQAFGFQLENGIPIESWFDDATDTELLKLLPFLDVLLSSTDVRHHVKDKFKLCEKVAKIKNEQALYAD